ncbi:MAG: hypothetical protein WBB36_08280 [Chitinophagales bacterium]
MTAQLCESLHERQQDQSHLHSQPRQKQPKIGSDVDLALKEKRMNYDSVVAISYELNEETLMPYHFNLLNFAAITNQELRAHINCVGKKIY